MDFGQINNNNPESNNIVKKLVDIVENMGKRLVNMENRNNIDIENETRQKLK